jgi:hypothetical protein
LVSCLCGNNEIVSSLYGRFRKTLIADILNDLSILRKILIGSKKNGFLKEGGIIKAALEAVFRVGRLYL